MPFMEQRAFTNYLPSCDVDACLMQRYGAHNSAEYRRFCTAHGLRVMADLGQGKVCWSPRQ
ncbi:MAG: hypothetical protein EOO40_12460 [Deltaproteobacteria bacterium]|nr:MAG: hypothetical protein EOO40_12460 [Deltaproteobacteria bacterium]